MQWVDRPNADGWIAELRRLIAGTDTTTPLDAATAADAAGQAEQTAALWRACGNWLRACDLPPYIFVPWVRSVTVTAPQVWRPELLALLNRYSEDYRDHADTATVNLAFRLSYSARSELAGESFLRAVQSPSPARGADYRRNSSSVTPRSFFTEWYWAEWYPGAGTAGEGEVMGLVPLEHAFATGLAMASWLVFRGTESAVDDCRQFAAVKNLETARAAAPGVLPSEAEAHIATDRAADLRLSREVDPDLVELAGAGATVGGILAAIPGVGPLAVVLVGLFMGLGAGLEAIFGRAVGWMADPWGRREPVLEGTAISGILLRGARVAPTQTLAEPPGGTPRTDGPVADVTFHDEAPKSGGGGGGILALMALAALVLSGSSRRRK